MKPLLWTVFFFWVVHYTWVLYAAIMNAKRVRDMGKLTAPARCMAVIALGIGYPLDALMNLVFCLVLWDRPREILLSTKLGRLCNGPDGWRRRRATWWRVGFLDEFDPDGVHHG